MKLDPKLKNFYLACSKLPIIGPFFLDPLLRGLWRFSVWLDSKLHPAAKHDVQAGVQLSSYAAVIHTLRQRIETLENNQKELQSQIDSHYWKNEYRHQLDAAVFDGVYQAIATERNTTTVKK
jgi:hypothetical protein